MSETTQAKTIGTPLQESAPPFKPKTQKMSDLKNRIRYLEQVAFNLNSQIIQLRYENTLLKTNRNLIASMASAPMHHLYSNTYGFS